VSATTQHAVEFRRAVEACAAAAAAVAAVAAPAMSSANVGAGASAGANSSHSQVAAKAVADAADQHLRSLLISGARSGSDSCGAPGSSEEASVCALTPAECYYLWTLAGAPRFFVSMLFLEAPRLLS
jgi:hypothetical protein